MASRYLELLKKIRENPEQQQALERDTHTLVIAGPGTGKTQTLVAKAAKLLCNDVFPPQSLACLTYAHSMVREMQDRMNLLGLSQRGCLFIGTLHGFCLSNILLPFGGQNGHVFSKNIRMASERQQYLIYKEIWDQFRYKTKLGWQFKPRLMRDDAIENYRLPIEFQKYRRTVMDNNAPNAERYADMLVQEYERRLQNTGLLDFDLQIKWSMQIIEQNSYARTYIAAKYPWILIDEYQDLGLPLHRIVKALASDTNIKFFIIGDPNQCIYEFAGASPDYIHELKEYTDIFKDVIYLTKSYRSLSSIVGFSSEIIKSDLTSLRTEEVGYVQLLKNEGQDGPQIIEKINDLTQDFKLLYDEIMVLCRNKEDCSLVANILEYSSAKIPCFRGVNAFYDSRKPFIEWIERMILHTLEMDDDKADNLRVLFEFWSKLLVFGGYSESFAFSLYNKVLLCRAVENAKTSAFSTRKWLEVICEELDIERLLVEYGKTRPDDLDEFQKLKLALDKGFIPGESLYSMLSHAQRENRVYVGTIHSSKGRESKAVIVARAGDIIKDIKMGKKAERRLLYVAVTRSRDHLYISYQHADS